VSSRDSEDLGSDLLAAKQRELQPLLDESAAILEFDYEQTELMQGFLDLAWFSGSRSSRDHLEARATQRPPGAGPLPIARLETEFKALMEESADALNLTVSRTIRMWNYLHEAWLAGHRTCETELMALLIETRSDVGAEALKWLEDEGAS
jgi:hypothetical protein